MTAQPNGSIYPQLPGFQKENRDLVYAMSEAGWTGRMTSKGHFLAKAPDGRTQITVTAKNGDRRGLKNAHAAFMRWLRNNMPADEQAIFDAAKAETDPLVKDVIAGGLVRKQTQRLVRKQTQRLAQEEIKRAHDEFMEAMMSDPRVEVVPLVRPWLARKQPGKDGGTRYESQAVLERIWPDGRTDYECAQDGCPWTSDKPVSVARHYGAAHTRKGVAAATEGPHHPDPTYTEPVQTRDYRPTQRLVDALVEWLEGTLDLRAASSVDLAMSFLEWSHDRPDIDHEPRPLVPMTDKQALDRIRLLVGQPDQTEQIESLTGELTEARRQRDEANAHLVKVQRDLDGIKDLMEGVGR